MKRSIKVPKFRLLALLCDQKMKDVTYNRNRACHWLAVLTFDFYSILLVVVLD